MEQHTVDGWYIFVEISLGPQETKLLADLTAKLIISLEII